MLTTRGRDPGDGARPVPTGRVRGKAQQSSADADSGAPADSTRRKGRDDEERELVNPPLRLFGLFLIPLVLLLVWALFFK